MPTNAIVGPAILFAPANRPEIFAKAAAKADMVILDLEDGAGDSDRDQVRRNIIEADLDPATTIVRVCGPEHPGFLGDVELVQQTKYSLVMVPKITTEIPQVLSGFKVIAMIETPQAVVNLQSIAQHPDVIGLLWGAEDLTVMLGGTHSRFMPDEHHQAGHYRDTMRITRALMHIHAAAAGKFSIDAVYADFHDDSGLFVEAMDAARSGFAGSACIHPRQLATVRRAYRPEPELVEWARRVVVESQNHPGAFKLDGQMVDAPLITQAHRVLERASAVALD